MPTTPTRTATVTQRSSPIPPAGTPLAQSPTIHPHTHPAARRLTSDSQPAATLPPDSQPAATQTSPDSHPVATHFTRTLISTSKTHTLHPVADIKPNHPRKCHQRPSTPPLPQFHEYLGRIMSTLGTKPQFLSQYPACTLSGKMPPLPPRPNTRCPTRENPPHHHPPHRRRRPGKHPPHL